MFLNVVDNLVGYKVKFFIGDFFSNHADIISFNR